MALSNFEIANMQRANALQELREAAHERYMKGRRNFVEGAGMMGVNPWERRQFVNGDATSRGLQAHELAMLRQQGANELGVATEKKLGMIGQGSDAAKATAAGAVDVEKLRGANHLTEVEKQIAAGQKLEETRGTNALSLAEKQMAGQANVALIQGENAVAAQAEANKGLAAKAALEAQMRAQEQANKLEIAQVGAGAKEAAAQQAANSRIIAGAIQAGAARGTSAAQVMAELAAIYKDNPAMLQAIKAYGTQGGAGGAKPTGTPQWEIVYDASGKPIGKKRIK